MDKIVFLATLAGKLSQYPMPADAIENSVAQVRGYIGRVSDAEFAADPATEEDVEAIARDIYEKYLSAQEAEQAAAQISSEPEAQAEAGTEPEADVNNDFVSTNDNTEDFDTVADTAVEQIFAAEDEPPAPEEIIEQLVVTEEYASERAAVTTSDEEFFEMLAKEAQGEREDQARIEELKLKALAMANKDDPDMVAQVLSHDEGLVEMVAASDLAEEFAPVEADFAITENDYTPVEADFASIESETDPLEADFDPIEAAFDPEERPDLAYEEAELTRGFTTETEFTPDLMIDKDELRRVDDDMPKKKKKVKPPKEKVKGSPLFWTLFALTLPITIPLLSVICAFFGVLYVAVTALIVAFAGVMIAAVACGTALALVGIIYGATQCFKSLHIGLFEIGIGIAVGGVTMLVSVLLYNIAIRFVPRLYKLVNRFGGWVFGGIGQLYTNIKKECGKKK